MAEVYTISGAGFGQPTAEQLDALQQKNAQVVARQQITHRISPATLLQNALKALGTATGDPALSKLKVDGIIGPATVKATNYAFATYLNAPNAMALAYIRQHIVYLTNEVTKYVQAHGGTIPTPASAQKALRALKAPINIAPPSSSTSLIPSMDGETPRWVWWVVGGVSVLVVLSLVARVVKGGSRSKRRRRARDDEE